MANQSPTECKNTEDARWMFNDRAQTPCQVLNASLHEFDTKFSLSWLELSFQCGQSSTSTPSNTSSALPSNTVATIPSSISAADNEDLIHDFCCSNVAYALYAACWSCQWDQPVGGYVRTTWADFWSSGNCTSSSSSTLSVFSTSSISSPSGHLSRRAPSNATTSSSSGPPRNAPLTKAVQRALDNAGIHIPSWAYLRSSGNGLWDESAALASVSSSASGPGSVKPNKLSGGAIAGTVIGVLLFISFLILCIFRIRNRRKIQTRLQHWDTHRRTINSSKHGHDNGTKQDLGLLGWGWSEWKECLWPFSATRSGTGTPQHNMTAISNRGLSNNALGGPVMQIGRLSPASDLEKRGSQGPASSKRVKSLFGRRKVDTISPVPALPSSTGARVDLDGDEGRVVIAPPPVPGLPTTGTAMGVSRMHSPEDYAKYNGPERVGSDLSALDIQALHAHPTQPSNSAHGHGYQRTTPTPTGAGAIGITGRKSLVDKFRGSLARVGDLGMGLSSRGRQSPRSSPAPGGSSSHGHGTHPNMYGEGMVRSASVRSNERYTHPMGSNKTPNIYSGMGMVERDPSPMGAVASRNPYANLASNNAAPLTLVNTTAPSANALLPPTGSSNPDISPTPSPIPLTKEALAIARVAQDGSLFVPLSAAHSQQQHQLTIQPTAAMDARAMGANDDVGIRLGESAMTRPTMHHHSTSDNSVLTGRFGGAGVPAWHADMTPLRSDSLRRLGVATSHEAPPTLSSPFTGSNPFPVSHISSGAVGENSLYRSDMAALGERPQFGEERVRTLSEGALARLNSATATSTARAGPSAIGGSSRQATHPLSGGQFPSRAVLAPIGRPTHAHALAGDGRVDSRGKSKAAKSEGSNGTSVKAAAGSAFGSSAREEGEDDDEDDDEDEEEGGGDGSGIQSVASPTAATAGSSSSGSKPNGGATGRNAVAGSNSRGQTRGKRKSKKREVNLRHLSTTTGTSASGGTDERNARLSVLANTSLSSGQAGVDRSIAGYGGGVKSDGSRTPSPKVAPSAEWFNLFRGGNLSEDNQRDKSIGSSSKRDGDLARNKTAPIASTSTPAVRQLGKANTSANASTGGRSKWKVTNVDAFQPFASASTIGDTGVDVPATVPLIAKPQPRRVSPNSSKQELQQASTSKQPVASTSKQTQPSSSHPTTSSASTTTPIAALYATTMSGSSSSLSNVRNATVTTSSSTRTIQPQPVQPTTVSTSSAPRVARPPSPATSTVLPYLQAQSTGSSHALVDKPLPPVQPSQPTSRPMPIPSTNTAPPASTIPPLSMNPFPTSTRAQPSTNPLPASNVSVPSPVGPRALPSPTSPSGTRPIRMLPVPPSNSQSPPF